MHGTFYNQAVLELALYPRTPLLIKAGAEGAAALDPTLPDMNFVRTARGSGQAEVYIPGSSLRGVIRSYAERLLRSVEPTAACDPTGTGAHREGLRRTCFARQDTTRKSGAEAYNESCYACRLFGNTALASRVRIGDFYVEGEPTLEIRHGVAIDRVTAAVAQGPFEIETLTEATFGGRISVRNFTVGQLGLVAAALLDLGDGLVPIGFGKSKGLGRLAVTFRRLAVRTVVNPNGRLLGAGALRRQGDDYRLPQNDEMAWEVPASRVRGFYEAALEEDAAIRRVLEEVAGRWPREVGA